MTTEARDTPAPAPVVKPRQFKTIVLPPRVAVIGDLQLTIDWGTRRVACASYKQLPLHFRVIPRRKGYSLGTDPLTAKERAESKRLRLHLLPELPKTRADCKDGPRPCMLFRCSMNLWLDVNPESGSIKLNFPDMEPAELEYTCALDVADRYRSVGGTTLEHVGLLAGITLERTRQIETDALRDLHLKLTGERRGDDKDLEIVEGSDADSVAEVGSDENGDWEDECG